MKYKPMNSEFFSRNRDKLVSRMKNSSLAIFVSNDEMPRCGDQNFPFRQNSDFLYLTGIDQEDSILCLCPNHINEKFREILFIKKTDDFIAVWQGHKYTLNEAIELSGIKNIMWLDDFNKILPELMYASKSVYLNLQENIRFSTNVVRNERRFVNTIINDYPLHKYRRVAPIINDLRMVKETEEIEMLKMACQVTKNAFFRAIKAVKPNAMEYEVEAELIYEITRNGSANHSFQPIVAGGKNGCVLHYTENNKPLNDGELLLIDFGAEYGNYAADCTRTIPINGKFTPRQKQVYEACLNVFNEAKKMFVPDNTISNIQNEVVNLMEKQLINLGLFTEEDVANQNPLEPLYKKYYMHGISHFIGLDVHDVGSKEEKFQCGMVLSCEPGIYIPQECIGVRIETDMLVAENPIDLLAEIPVEVDEIEMLMRQSR